MGKYVLCKKSDDKLAYRQIFETSADNPTGLLGGSGQRDWYWVDVTGWEQSELDKLTDLAETYSERTPGGGEDIDADNANEVITGGTWS